MMDCPDQRNHHLYTRCGTCREVGASIKEPDGTIMRLTIETVKAQMDDSRIYDEISQTAPGAGGNLGKT